MDHNGRDLVTGGGGFIGSHLVDALLAAGRRVRVLDSFVVGRRANLAHHADNPHLEIVEADVADAAAVSAATEGCSRVFHLAARADIVPSIETPEPYFRANVDGTFHVLEAARAAGVRRLVYVASSSCYGIPDVYPTPETAPIQPRYPYALTKFLGEQLVMHWGEVYDLPVISLRFFNVYGPRARTSGTYGAVFGVFLAQLAAGKPLTVVGDGTQTRDFAFVTDVVEALVMAADSSLGPAIYNVGTGRPQSVNRLVELLDAPEIVHVPKRPGEPDCTQADITRVTRDLGWAPRVDFPEGVAVMRAQLAQWQEAPVWTAETIAEATRSWFHYLSDDSAEAVPVQKDG